MTPGRPKKSPPPVPPAPAKPFKFSFFSWVSNNRILFGLLVLGALVTATVMMGRVWGVLRLFRVPVNSMAPAIARGDHVLMEGITYLSRQPQRGDIVAFQTKGIAALPPGQVYIKRVAGLPGEQLAISNASLFINGVRVCLSNTTGLIVHTEPPGFSNLPATTSLSIPKNHYFVLGDNSTNSSDSRFWGVLPRTNIMGRIIGCYWPPSRTGRVK